MVDRPRDVLILRESAAYLKQPGLSFHKRVREVKTEFLGKDMARFASLARTQQGQSGTRVCVDDLKARRAIGFYDPDWVVVQKTEPGEVNWNIETKGRVWGGAVGKQAALVSWC